MKAKPSLQHTKTLLKSGDISPVACPLGSEAYTSSITQCPPVPAPAFSTFSQKPTKANCIAVLLSDPADARTQCPLSTPLSSLQQVLIDLTSLSRKHGDLIFSINNDLCIYISKKELESKALPPVQRTQQCQAQASSFGLLGTAIRSELPYGCLLPLRPRFRGAPSSQSQEIMWRLSSALNSHKKLTMI